MLSCKQATELISLGLDRELSLRDRLGLRLHLLICRGCRVTRQHLDFLRAATQSLRQRNGAPHD